MGVSMRNTVPTGLTVCAVLALAGTAYAGGGSGPPKPPPAPYHGKSGGHPCCGGPPVHNVVVPGVKVGGPKVIVGGSHVSVHQGSVVHSKQVYAFGGGGGGSTAIISGGGAAYPAPAINPAALGALNVTGGEDRIVETVLEDVAITEEFCIDEITETLVTRPVRAVCIDDNGTPHPASQVGPAEQIDASYSGEVYRCMAGTSMQVTLGTLANGTADYSQAETFTCAKGEALVHRPGGQLGCAVQTPRRDCNERSLLRRYGPGTKLVQVPVQETVCIPQTRTVMQTVERQVERIIPFEPQPIVLDGGVGQGY